MSRTIDACAASGRRRALKTQSGDPIRKRNGCRATVDLRPPIVHPDGSMQREQQRRRRYHGSPRLVGAHRHPCPRDGHLGGHAGRSRKQQRRDRERADHRRPLMDTARAASRSATRLFNACRVSCCFLPRPSAMATFAADFCVAARQGNQGEALLFDGADELLDLLAMGRTSFRARTGSWL